MSTCGEIYHPVTRPPANPNVRLRKTSRDHMQNNPNSLVQAKRNSKHNKILHNKQEKKLLIVDTLQVDTLRVERSHSWNNLKNASLNESHRSLSASNLYALTDPNLSLQQAVSKKEYDKPNTSYAKEKATFTAWTQKYFYQLTVGCGKANCINVFCKSSVNHKKFNIQMAALISIELSTFGDQHLCIKEEKFQKAVIFHEHILNDKQTAYSKDGGRPFLYQFYSTSPFRSLFLPCPLTSSGLSHRTHSHNELAINNSANSAGLSTKLQNHLKLIATTISSSLSNIWKSCQGSCENIKRQNIQQSQCPGPSIPDVSQNLEYCNKSTIDEDINVITTRTRITSFRLFGNDHAVDTDCTMFDDIDEFENSVSQELKSNTKPEIVCVNDEVAIKSDSVDGLNTDGYSLTHLTLEMFNTVIEYYQECGDESFLTNTLRTVFSSWKALNLSFSYEGIKKSAAFSINVNIADVEKMFKELLMLDHGDKYISILVDTVQVMLLGRKDGITNPSDLKPLVIILEIPSLFNYYGLIQKVASIMCSLSKRCQNALVCYFSWLTKEKFLSMVKGFQSLLCSEINWSVPLAKNTVDLANYCKTLQLLYSANNLRENSCPIIKNSEFYCCGLTKKINFKMEYVQWKNSVGNGCDSILNYPFLLEPAVKVQVMHIDAITQMREEYQDAIVHQARVQQVQKSWTDFADSSPLSTEVRSAMCPYLLLEVRREHFIEDTLQQLHDKRSDFKKPMKIKYTNGGEQGLDMGGLQKEFFQVVVETVFNPIFGLFTTTEDGGMAWFNAFSLESTEMFEFVGILLGLAIYNGIILDIHFPLLVYKKLLDFSVGLEDLREIQPTLCNGLEQVLNHPGDVENDLCLTFEVSHALFGGTVKSELLANGSNVMVNNENRQHFVDLYVNSILNRSIEKQFDAFKKGFYLVCYGPAVKLFTAPELELLICGSPDLDFKALENVTEYKDGFTKTHPLILEFWKIVHEFTSKQKQSLLMFVTGSFRVPLRGLGSMSFYIQRNGPDSNNLPTSMTCFNRLLLPEYKNDAKLKRMLLLAIENSKGFGLT